MDLPTQSMLPKNCDKGIVICGWRHGNIIGTLKALAGLRSVLSGPDSVGNYEQGFLTNTNRFVDRKEAADIAFEAGQINDKLTSLFSEDVW